MAALPKILLKTLAFAGLLLVLQVIYRYTQYEQEAAANLDLYTLLDTLHDGQIVYYGESSNITYSDLDFNKGPISDFLQSHFPDLRVRGLTYKAAHAGVYRDLIRLLPDTVPQRTIVVTMNLRSFGPTWINSRLETSLQKQMMLLGPGPALWRRFLLSFKHYDIHSEEEWMEIIRDHWRHDTLTFPYPFPYPTAASWDTAISKVANIPGHSPSELADLILSTHYVKAYAFQIDTLTNPRIADFDAIVDYAHARGWNIVLPLIPENLETAQRLLGDTLTHFIRDNARLLEQRYTRRGATVVNMLDILPHRDFIDKDWTTEHYVEHGRRAVAGRIALAIRKYYPDHYDPAAYDEAHDEVIFFNDMEGPTVWSQMHTTTTERAYRGKKSSKIGDPEKFSTTWTAGISNLDTTQLDTIEVSFWLYQTNLDHLAGLAIEASGDSISYLWDTTGIRRITRTLDQWTPVKFSIPLWPQITRADIIKTYIYNPSSHPIWIDDMRIRFIPKKETLPIP